MPRKALIVEYCDVCWAEHNTEVPAVRTDTISFGKTTRELMTCDKHAKPVAAFRTLWECGIRPDSKTPSSKAVASVRQVSRPTLDGAYPCRVKGCKESFEVAQGLGAHMRTKHPGMAAKLKER